MDLKTYAAASSRVCTVCTLPPAVRKEVADGWTAGIRTSAILKWLEEEKHITTATRRHLNNHFTNKHEERCDAKKR